MYIHRVDHICIQHYQLYKFNSSNYSRFKSSITFFARAARRSMLDAKIPTLDARAAASAALEEFGGCKAYLLVEEYMEYITEGMLFKIMI